MSFKEFRNKPIVKIISNRYVLILMIFIVWMVFFDENSWLNHSEFNKEIKKLKTEQEHYNSEIEKDKKIIKNLENDEGLEKFAREKYNMKKENEDIYIIEYDTLKNR